MDPVMKKCEAEVRRVSQLTMQQIVNELHLTTITKQTYVYINLDGELEAMEKRYNFAYPANEWSSIGYLRTDPSVKPAH